MIQTYVCGQVYDYLPFFIPEYQTHSLVFIFKGTHVSWLIYEWIFKTNEGMCWITDLTYISKTT